MRRNREPFDALGPEQAGYNLCKMQSGGSAGSSIRSIRVRFRIANGDGVGDLAASQRLDYLAWLGVDAIWISPIYPSPMADFGYDVSDYCDIDPLFGTLAGFRRADGRSPCARPEAVIDFVPNHTSIEHPWFRESRVVARQSQARLVYLARSGAGRRAAQQLAVAFSAAAPGSWTRRPASITITRSYKKQPDLNWRNPDVRRRCSMCCASGSTAAWMAFGSMCIWQLIKDDRVPRQPAQPRLSRPASRRIESAAAALHDRSARGARRSSPACGRCSTSIRTA